MVCEYKLFSCVGNDTTENTHTHAHTCIHIETLEFGLSSLQTGKVTSYNGLVRIIVH